MTQRKVSKSILLSTLSAVALSGCSSAIQAPPPLPRNAEAKSRPVEPQVATFSTPQRQAKSTANDAAVDDITARSEQFAAMMEAWMKNHPETSVPNRLASEITAEPVTHLDNKPTDPIRPDQGGEFKPNQPITSTQLEPSRAKPPVVEIQHQDVGPEPSAVIAERTVVSVERDEPPAPTVRLSQPTIDPFALLDDRFTRRVQSDPRDIDAQLDLQLLRYLNEKPIPSSNELAALPNEDRELLTALLDGLANFRSTIARSDAPLAVEKARPWLEAAERIRSRSDLAILSASLCTSVRAYGNYDPIEPLRFVASSPRPMVFYCEVDGFLSQLDKDERWETRLAMELRLFTESGMEVWQDKTESVEDHSRRRRRDFFINKRIQFPSNLAPGLYLLKCTVQDLVANRVSETTISVELVSGTATSK